MLKKFCAVAELANKQLEKIEDCTEKTPSHQEVWAQRGRMKKILMKTKTLTAKLELLGSKWKILNDSEAEDNLDLSSFDQFLIAFNQVQSS